MTTPAEPPSLSGDALVGRVAERGLLRKRITIERQRLVTIWGPGGIGKTRLARELVRDVAAEFSGGSLLCALEGARRGADVVAIVGRAIAIAPSNARSHEDRVARIGRALMARGETLLVLDNVEQIVGDVCAALSVWMTIAPATTFVVTSRELLGVAGESACELSPLGVPQTDADVYASDAVELLLRRARNVLPDFQADPHTLREIVARLDGIPLAIELAAARLAVLSARQLALRLDRRFEVLAVRHGGADTRQRTLRGAIDWSWELLDRSEQNALSQLSVFHGAFDLEAAEAVLDDAHAAASLLHALRSKSLLVVAAADAPGGAPRFSLLESIRDYAREKLGDRREELEARHAAYYLATAEIFAADVDGHGGEDALRWLTREQPSLVTLVDRQLEQASPAGAELALRAVLALEPMLSIHGAHALIVDLLARVEAARALENFPDALRLRFLEVRASSALVLGQLHEASRAIEAAQILAVAAGDVHHARVLTLAAYFKQAQGQQEEAMRMARQALVLAEAAGARREQGMSLDYIGLVFHVADAFTDALEYYERALAIHVEVGHLRAEIRTRARLGFLMQDLGRSEDAIAQCERAQLGEEKLEGRHLSGTLVGYIGNFRRAQGRTDEAREHYARAIELLRRAGNRRFEATFTMDRGIALILDGRYSEALTDLATAGAITEEVGDRRLSALVAGYELTAHAALGHLDEARAALGRGEAQLAIAKDEATLALLRIHAAQIDVLVARQSSGPERDTALARARAIAGSLRTPILGEHRRVAALLLEREIARAEPSESALFVVPDGSRMRVGNAEDATWIDLAAHPSTQRVLALLVHRRVASPGVAVSANELVEAGWPGEKMVTSAGANRLRVLLTGLRSNGLRTILKSEKGGYWLDALVPIVVVDPKSTHD